MCVLFDTCIFVFKQIKQKMEDTKSLLMMVLHKVFQNQPKIIENTFQLIHNFNNGKINKRNYEKILRTICDLLNDELPSPILFYILTLVDMPQDFESTSPIVEKMKKTHDFLPEINVRPYLLTYLNNIKPTSSNNRSRKDVKNEILEKNVTSGTISDGNVSSEKKSRALLKPSKRNKRSNKNLLKYPGSPDCLLNICASYVIANEKALKLMYKKKQNLAWRLINTNAFSGNKVKQCYDVVKDLNTKSKWLREIESGNITTELLMEEYNDSTVFLKINNNVFDYDPFQLSKECDQIINDFFGL